MKAFTYLLGTALFIGSLTTLGCDSGGTKAIEGGPPKDVDLSKQQDMSNMPGYNEMQAKTKSKTK